MHIFQTMWIARGPTPSFVRRGAYALVLVCTLWSRAGAQGASPGEAARIDSVFRRYGGRSPGCALTVRRDGATYYAHAYGLASLELGVPIGQHTVFDIGSATKEFTAASVLLLAQDHKLSLDDDIRKYVPELPALAPVTLRQLLTHTSGWRDYVQMLSWQGHYVRDYVTATDALNVLEHQRSLSFQPGTDYRYSNTGYFLMALVVQRVTGESLAAFAQRRIFDPLGMRHTRYVEDSREVIADGATAYEPAPTGGWRTAMSDWNDVGAGGVHSTTEDLARWDANFDDPTVGGRALVDSLTTPEHLANGVAIPYGLGLFVDSYAGRRRVWHNGIWAGYRAIYMRFPDDRLSIIALCNAADVASEPMADAVASILLPPQPPQKRVPLSTLRVADAADIAGTYYSSASDQRVSIVPTAVPSPSPGRLRRPSLPWARASFASRPARRCWSSVHRAG